MTESIQSDEVRSKVEQLTERIDRLVGELTEVRAELAALLPEEQPLSEPTEEQAQSETPKADEVVTPEEQPSPVDPEPTIDPLLEEKVPELTLETAFEPMVSFRTSGSLSVADSFFFANELFGGSRAELERVLEEVDRFSSVSQLQHYLYDTLQLAPDREEVARFYDFILSHSTAR